MSTEVKMDLWMIVHWPSTADYLVVRNGTSLCLVMNYSQKERNE